MNFKKLIGYILIAYFLLILISSFILLIFFKGGFACGSIAVFQECSPLEAVMENIIFWGGTYLIFFLLPILMILFIIYLFKNHKK
jgi:hypothetical protein